MGLFSRKDSSTSRKSPVKPRPSVSSEAQAAELRVRARRRLAGAVALVLAAIVVLPMLLDSEPMPVSKSIDIRIPDRTAPFAPNLSDPSVAESANAGVTQAATATPAAPVVPEPPVMATPAPVAPVPAPTPAAPKPEPKAKAEVKVEPKAEQNKPTVSKGPRSDDGARALALLEGRPSADVAGPPGGASNAGKPPTKGNFVVQAMSLDASADAQSQKEKLSASGVSNAFVDGPVQVNGSQKYRVRVGPFSSREAAQAAQTRLRTLGFGGAFITSQ